jgi:hypothetical protein
MAQMRASWAVRSAIPAPEAAPSLAASATSSMASPIRARRSSVEHTLETIGQRDHDRDGFRPLRTTSPRLPSGPPRSLRTSRLRRPDIGPLPPGHPCPAPGSASRRFPYPGGSRRVARAGAGAGRRAYGGLLHCGQLCRECGWRSRRKFFSAHRPWTASVQVAGQRTPIVKHCPHFYPQLAHSVIGVSAQSFHKVVHTAIGRPGRVGTRLS